MWASVHALQAVKQEYAATKIILRGIGSAQKAVSRANLQDVCPDLELQMVQTGKAILSLTFPLASFGVLNIIAEFVETSSYSRRSTLHAAASPSASDLYSVHLAVYLAAQKPSIPSLRSAASQELLYTLPQVLQNGTVSKNFSSAVGSAFSTLSLRDELCSEILLSFLFNFDVVGKSQDLAQILDVHMPGLYGFLFKTNASISGQKYVMGTVTVEEEKILQRRRQEAVIKNIESDLYIRDLKGQCESLREEICPTSATTHLASSKHVHETQLSGLEINASVTQDVTMQGSIAYLKQTIALYQSAIAGIGRKLKTDGVVIESHRTTNESEVARDIAILRTAEKKLMTNDAKDAETQISSVLLETETTVSSIPLSQPDRLSIDYSAIKHKDETKIGSASSRKLIALQKELEDMAQLKKQHRAERKQLSAQLRSLQGDMAESLISNNSKDEIIAGLEKKIDNQKRELAQLNQLRTQQARHVNKSHASRQKDIKAVKDLLKKLG